MVAVPVHRADAADRLRIVDSDPSIGRGRERRRSRRWETADRRDRLLSGVLLPPSSTGRRCATIACPARRTGRVGARRRALERGQGNPAKCSQQRSKSSSVSELPQVRRATAPRSISSLHRTPGCGTPRQSEISATRGARSARHQPLVWMYAPPEMMGMRRRSVTWRERSSSRQPTSRLYAMASASVADRGGTQIVRRVRDERGAVQCFSDH